MQFISLCATIRGLEQVQFFLLLHHTQMEEKPCLWKGVWGESNMTKGGNQRFTSFAVCNVPSQNILLWFFYQFRHW